MQSGWSSSSFRSRDPKKDKKSSWVRIAQSRTCGASPAICRASFSVRFPSILPDDWALHIMRRGEGR